MKLLLKIALVATLYLQWGRVAAHFNTFDVYFPANFAVGDYVEFAKLNTMDAESSGYYEVTISYAKGSIAVSSTHLVSVGHTNADVWREAGKVNINPYVLSGRYNFTIDCNTAPSNSRLRVRAVATYGEVGGITVHVKVRAIANATAITSMEVSGNEEAAIGLLAMTDEWDLIVGNNFNPQSGTMAIKVKGNGNVGIGTSSPEEHLSVKGKIRAQEIKVEAANWPDYVFESDYNLKPLTEIEAFIKANGHLPEMPKAAEAEADGVSLGEMNKLLLKKVEELTLHLIEKEKDITELKKGMAKLNNTINTITANK